MKPGTPTRILSIEDDPAQARLLGARLQGAGYEVVVAATGAEGLDRLRDEAFDLLLVDQSLPETSGVEVLRALQDSGRRIPAIMITGAGDESVAVEAMKLGAGDYLVKDPAGSHLALLPAAVERVLACERLLREKQRADEALRREKAFTDSMLDSLEDMCYLFDAQGRYLRWNRALCEVSGYSDAEVAAMRPEGFFVPEDQPRVAEAIRRVWAGEQLRVEARILTRDGRRVPFEFTGALLRDAEGQPVGLCGTGRDVSDRNAAREALQQRTDELHERVKELNCLLGISRLLEEDDFSLEELLQKTAELVPPAMQYPEITAARITLGEHVALTDNFAETPWRLAAPLRAGGRSVGTWEIYYLQSRPPADEGPFLKEERAMIDALAERLGKVAERTQAQSEVRSLKQQIEFVLGATRTGLDIIDADYTLLYVDPAWRRTYGPFEGRKCYEYFMGRSAPCENCAGAQALWENRPVVQEATLPREDNRPVQVTSIPFEDGRGRWLVAEVNVDLSERKRVEREMAQAHRLESIGHLAAGIAHEINTPIQFIGDNVRFIAEAFEDLGPGFEGTRRLIDAAKHDAGAAEAASELQHTLDEADLEFLVEEIPKAARQSLEGVARVAGIVRAMKEFSHPADEQKQSVDLNRALQNTLTISRNEWKYHAEAVTEFDPALPPVPCLPGELNQALLNLVVNAGQAVNAAVEQGLREHGTITVRTRQVGGEAEIEIEDTGVGIPEEIRDRVYDPFFTTKEVGRGTGQGLSVVHSVIVERHGGSIRFDSTPGVGTKFVVRLPLLEKPSGATRRGGERSTAAGSAAPAKDAAELAAAPLPGP